MFAFHISRRNPRRAHAAGRPGISADGIRLPAIARRVLRALSGILLIGAAAACDQVTLPAGGGGGITRGNAVPVALLVPLSDGNFGAVARSLENAARLAAADLDGAAVDITVYDTAGDPATAARVASQAVDAGAQVIVGPLLSQTTSAATAAVGGRVAILSFSNNPAVAGGNVFVLGPTFADVAGRLTGYGARNGLRRLAVVHSQDIAGEVGRDAITAAARGSGMSVAAVESYPLSQRDILAAGPRIAASIQSSGADAVFLTASADSDLPLVATTLTDAGMATGSVQLMGLTRWNASPGVLSIPGLQGGWFTLPERSALSGFENRYSAAYGGGPSPVANLAYDAIQAVGSLAARGRAPSPSALTQGAGFAGASGIFRLRADGTNQRGLAVARIEGGRVVIVDPAPRSFGGAGF